MITNYKRLGVWSIVIAIILLIPFVAMQFTAEVNWKLSDFLITGSALIFAVVSYELIARRSTISGYRLAFGIGLLAAFLLFWVNGAVGIIGDEGQEANLLYGAVYAVGIIGSFIANFESRGMAHTFFTVAIVQMLVPLVALIIWPPPSISWSPGILRVFLLSSFFASLFVISAIIFRKAANSRFKV